MDVVELNEKDFFMQKKDVLCKKDVFFIFVYPSSACLHVEEIKCI
jgi:hypothetical protein